MAILLLLHGFSFAQPFRGFVPPELAPSTQYEGQLPLWPRSLLKPADTVTISFIGDVMQHSPQLKSALTDHDNPSLSRSYDYSHAFKYTSGLLTGTDLAVANMEFTLGTYPYTGYPHFSAPAEIAVEAARSGIGLFQIANNHIADKGKSGLERTLDIYDSLAVPYTGVYRSCAAEEENNPKILSVKGIKIGFINFTYGTNGITVPDPFVVNRMDSLKIKEAIGRGFERGAEIMIALPHWGEEYHLYPSESQKELAAMLIRNGVKVIIGTHPHVIQKSETNDSTVVFYSLGNYISNQSEPVYTKMGLLVTITIARDNLTGKASVINSGHKYLWCFKKGEFEDDYTVVPVESFFNGTADSTSAARGRYEEMIRTYKYLQGLKLLE